MSTQEERIKLLENFKTYKFGKSHLWLIGQGSIGPALLFMILKLFEIKLEQITVIDMKPESEIRPPIDHMVKVLRKTENKINIIGNTHINLENYKKVFAKLKMNDMVVDCAYDIGTLGLIKLFQKVGCSYVNSAIEDWDYKTVTDPFSYTIFAKLQEIRKYSNSLSDSERKFTAMLGCGCNPGMVSVWAQVAIDKINEYYKNKTHKNAEELGVRTVHISEVDTQRTKNPKNIDEYCNTWGSTMEPLYEEALAPLEMSFGSHEDMPIANVVKFDEENRVLVMDRIAMNTLAQSYTPLYGNFIGMMIRHEENVTIGEKLSTYKKQDGKLVKTWAPTVHYVYKPCNETLGSLAELKDKNYNYQTNYRLLVDDIIEGRDELGLSFFLENGDIFWIGSLLDIDEARNIYMNEFSRYMNATTVQVVGGYLSGIMFAMDKHMKGEHGVYVPDDMDYKKVFDTMKPFYGEFRFEKLEKDDWDSDNFNKNNSFSKMKEKYKVKCEWKLKDFLVDPEKVLGLSRCSFFKFNETVDKCFSI